MASCVRLYCVEPPGRPALPQEAGLEKEGIGDQRDVADSEMNRLDGGWGGDGPLLTGAVASIWLGAGDDRGMEVGATRPVTALRLACELHIPYLRAGIEILFASLPRR